MKYFYNLLQINKFCYKPFTENEFIPFCVPRSNSKCLKRCTEESEETKYFYRKYQRLYEMVNSKTQSGNKII